MNFRLLHHQGFWMCLFFCLSLFFSFFVLISFRLSSNGGNQTHSTVLLKMIVSTYITQKRSISFEMAYLWGEWTIWLVVLSKSGFIDMLHRFRNISLNEPNISVVLFLLLQSKGIFREFCFFLLFQWMNVQMNEWMNECVYFCVKQIIPNESFINLIKNVFFFTFSVMRFQLWIDVCCI